MSESGSLMSPVRSIGSQVTLTCTVELDSAVLESELSLLMVDAQLSRDGTMLSLSGPIVTGMTFTYTQRFESFRRIDSGNYTCTAAVKPRPTATYLITSETHHSDVKLITTGIIIIIIIL